MGLGRRNARQHETVGFQKNALDTSTFWEFKPQQQVMTVDGVPGVVTAVLDGPYPGTEEYEVTLDNGLGGGSYTASQLSPLGDTTASHDHEATGLHLASDDYPEMGSILYDRPPIERMTFNAVRGDNPFEIRHEEINTGGTKFPRRVDMTAHHPETGEQVGNARYFPPKRKGGPISIDEVKANAPGAASAMLNEIEARHPGSRTHFMNEVKRNNNNPDVTGHQNEDFGKPSDWDTHYPNVADTIHRGIALKLPSYSASVVNSPGNTKEEHLDVIHREMPTGPNIGTHWTENEHSAQLFAHNAIADYRNTIPVVLHAEKPARKDIETRQPHLYRGGVLPYGNGYAKENEIPVRRGREVKVTGISWKPDAPHPDADEHGWIHHTYPEPKEHTAARSEFEGHDRAVDAELPDEIHRGFSLRLSPEDHEVLHDESRPASERAQILMNHYHDMHERNRDGQNLGRHWSTDSGVARGFSKQKAYNASPYDFNALEPTSTQVVFHAQTPSTKSMISSPRTRDKYTILPHSHGEQEVPVRRNTTLNINGVSWARNEPGSEMTRHDFEQPLRMKAALEDLTDEDEQEAEPELPPCAYCGSDQMEIAGDTGRAQQARCQVCGGMMSAPYGLQFKPELIGDPSNHPKDDPDPASGGVPGAANMRVPVKRMNDSDYTASLHTAYGYNDGTTATKHMGFAGYIEGLPDTKKKREPFDDEDAHDMEKNQAIGVNGQLGYLRSNVSSKNPGFWHKHAEIKDVSLHEPIYSTQPRVVDEHVQRYLDNPEDETAHTKLWKEHAADEPEYPGSHMPMFIRHEGRTYVHDGHHRVSAALLRKDPSIKGYMYDADEKGIPTKWEDERDEFGLYDRSHGFSKYSAWSNTNCAFDFSDPDEELRHELMHHDQDICVATHAHHNSRTASIDERGWGLFRTASDEEDTSYRMQHQAPDADYGAPLHDVENMMPGFYDRPHQYNFGQEDFHTSANVIQKARGNPEHRVRIYRALPAEHAGKGFNTGDWVSTSKDYARTHGMASEEKGSKHDWPVISTVVPAKHLNTEGDVHEWAYNGPHQPNASVAFKGGYHQEVRQRADGSIGPVQRKANPFKERAENLKSKGYSFSHYGPNSADPGHTVVAWDPEQNWAGRVQAHSNGDVHNVEIEPGHAHEPLEQHMRDMIAQKVKKTSSLHEANERDWCTFRRSARCYYPGPAGPDDLRMSTPQDRGPCAWDYWQQQVCPISEPGPMALMQAKGSLVNDDIRDPEFPNLEFSGNFIDHAQGHEDDGVRAGQVGGQGHEAGRLPDLDGNSWWAQAQSGMGVWPQRAAVRTHMGTGEWQEAASGDAAASSLRTASMHQPGSLAIGDAGGAQHDPWKTAARMQKSAASFHSGEHEDDSYWSGLPAMRTGSVEASLADFTSQLDREGVWHFTASWSDVRAKAKRIRSEGKVNITVATREGVGGEVKGDHHVYETLLTYVPGTSKVGAWECGCKWAAFAWGRSPAYRRFEGRMCSHALAMQFEAQARGMFGRTVEPNNERPKWLRHHTPVVTQYERDSGENLTRRAVPPGNMRRTYEGGRNEDFANAVMADYLLLKSADVEDVYDDGHALDLVHPPVYAQLIEQLPEIGPVEAMKWMAALGMTHAAARAVLKDASAELATGQLHFEASLRLLAEEHEHGDAEKKRCPDCGSMISVNDEKCPHCHHVFMKHEHHHGAKTPAEGDLMSRGMVIGGDWDHDAVHRMMNGQATAHDLLHHVDKEDAGDFWYPHEPHLSREENLSGAKDFARTESSEHPAEDLDRDHPIGEVGMVLVGHKPAGWNPENNPDHGLLGNSYIPHSADVPLHEIHYQDHHGDWHSADASGHSVHVTGGGYDEPTQHVAAQAEPPSVSGVALKAADTGRVLMLQRGLHDEDDPAAGTWEFPGGHHEEGDRTSLDAGIREWEEETGHPFPEGGVVHHTWTSPNGVYQGHVVVIPEEGAVQFGHGRQVVNPDNPDGDQHEQAAWWDPDHARKNPALREELKTGTPWKEIKAAGNAKTAATADPLYGLEEASPMSPPQHSTSTNPASSGWATTQDPHSWDDPEENSTNFGALPSDGFLGSLHDQPEPALPSTDGAEAELADERDNADPSQYDENDAELTPNVTTNSTVASAGSAQDIVARFQATAGARALGGSGGSNGGHHAAQQANNKEIANAAKQFLTKSALKDFNFAEQQELINEGALDKTMARNSDVLDIEGTHYSALEAALAAEDVLEDSADLFA